MSEQAADVPGVSSPVVRPRRLRTTPALRRMVAETAVRPSQLVLPLFVREGLAEPHPIASMPGVVQHSRSSLLKAAHEAATPGSRRRDAVRHPGVQGRRGLGGDRPGRRPQPGHHRRGGRGRRRAHGDERPVPRRVHRPRALRPADPRRARRQRPHARGVRRDGPGPRRRRRRHGRPQRDDGRSGGGGPRGPRRRRAAGRGDPGVLRQVRLRLLRPVPRGRRLVADRRPAYLPAGPRQRPRGRPRGAARRRAGRRRGDGQAGARLPRRRPPRARRGDRARGGVQRLGRVRHGRGRRRERLDRPRGRHPRDPRLDPPRRRRRDPHVLGRRGRPPAPADQPSRRICRSRSTRVGASADGVTDVGLQMRRLGPLATCRYADSASAAGEVVDALVEGVVVVERVVDQALGGALEDRLGQRSGSA